MGDEDEVLVPLAKELKKDEALEAAELAVVVAVGDVGDTDEGEGAGYVLPASPSSVSRGVSSDLPSRPLTMLSRPSRRDPMNSRKSVRR